MKQLWKHVKAVEKHMPRRHRVEMAGSYYAELREDVKRLEARLGRSPEPAEIDEILKNQGDPEQIAHRLAGPQCPQYPLVERYISAITRALPNKEAVDVVAEVREALFTQIESREADKGRDLNDGEIEALLKNYGAPMLVAARYDKQSYLIGPDTYPYFWPTLKTVIGMCAAFSILGAGYFALTDGRWTRFVPQALDIFLSAILPALGILLVVFILLDRSDAGKKISRNWKPSSLPKDDIRKPISRFESAFALGWSVLFILWWINVVDFSNVFGGDRRPSVELHFSSGWDAMYLPILVVMCVSAAGQLYDLMHPGWTRIRSIAHLAVGVATIAILVILLRSEILVIAGEGGSADPAQAAKITSWLNSTTRSILIILAILHVFALLMEGLRFAQSVGLQWARKRSRLS